MSESKPIFDLTVICKDNYESYESMFEKNSISLLIYCGDRLDEVENYIVKLWNRNIKVSLSTFLEEPSFYHAGLGKKIILDDSLSKTLKEIISGHLQTQGLSS